MQTDSSQVRSIVRWIPLGLIAAAVLAYSNSFSGAFLFDDAGVVVFNQNIFYLWPPWKAVIQITRPVPDISFALNHALSGFNAADYHMVNLAIHIVAGLLLYGIVRRALLLPRMAGRFDRSAPWLAGASAGLWLVHPLQTESVTYIAQRIESMMGMFYLLSVYGFLRGVASPRPRGWMDLSLVACALAVCTKEVAVTLPVMIFLLDGILVSPGWLDAWRARWKYYVALAGVMGIFAVLLFMSVGAHAVGGVALLEEPMNRWHYLLTQLSVITHYLRLSFVPYPLCLYYNWPLVETVRPVLLPGALILVLGLATLWGLCRRSPLSLAGAWLFLILAPTSSLMPIADVIFEHRMYLPLAGVVVFTVLGLYLLADRLQARWQAQPRCVLVLSALAVLTVMGFGVLTYSRNLDYRSEEVMWRDVIRKRPDNYKAYIGLSFGLLSQERFVEAANVCSNVLALLPDLAKIPEAEIQTQWRGTLAREVYSMAHNNLGIALLNLQQLDEAQTNYALALRAVPDNHWAHNNMAYVYFLQERLDDAIAQWRLTLKSSPDDVKAHCFLGLTMARKQKYAEALFYYRRALQIRPDFVFVRAQLAWLLATCEDDRVRNGKQAVEIASSLPRATQYQSPRAFDILAAAYAESGDFDAAGKLAEQALELARHPPELAGSQNAVAGTNRTASAATGAGTTNVSSTVRSYSEDEIQSRLNLYREGRPYRAKGTDWRELPE